MHYTITSKRHPERRQRHLFISPIHKIIIQTQVHNET